MCKLHAVTMLFQTTKSFHAPLEAKRLTAVSPLYSGCGAINRTSAKRPLPEYVAIKSRFKLFKNSIPCSAYRMEIAVSLGLAFMETEK